MELRPLCYGHVVFLRAHSCRGNTWLSPVNALTENTNDVSFGFQLAKSAVTKPHMYDSVKAAYLYVASYSCAVRLLTTRSERTGSV